MGKQKRSKKQTKVQQSSPAKSNQHKKVQNSITNVFLRPNAIPSTPPVKSNKKQDASTPAPTSQTSEPESTPLTSNKIVEPTNEPPTNPTSNKIVEQTNEPPTINNQQKQPPNQDMDTDDTSYLSVAKNSKHLPVVEKPVSTSFHLLKKLHDKGITRTNNSVDFADDETVCQGTEAIEHHRVRMTMMFVIPSKEEGVDDDEAPTEAIKKINLLLKTVINKIPNIRIGPWLVDKQLKKDSLLKKNFQMILTSWKDTFATLIVSYLLVKESTAD